MLPGLRVEQAAQEWKQTASTAHNTLGLRRCKSYACPNTLIHWAKGGASRTVRVKVAYAGWKLPVSKSEVDG